MELTEVNIETLGGSEFEHAQTVCGGTPHGVQSWQATREKSSDLYLRESVVIWKNTMDEEAAHLEKTIKSIIERVLPTHLPPLLATTRGTMPNPASGSGESSGK